MKAIQVTKKEMKFIKMIQQCKQENRLLAEELDNVKKRKLSTVLEKFNLKENLRVAVELLTDIVEAVNNCDGEGLLAVKEDAEVFLDDYEDEQKRRKV